MTSILNSNGNTNMDFLFSEPLLDAALAQINTLPQFRALQENFKVAAATGKTIPDTIQAKLSEKQRRLHETLVSDATHHYLSQSGLDDLVAAKAKWEDVHFMAEAHGVGSSIPMVSYTGLSQEALETGMNSFFEYIATHKVSTTLDPELRQEVCEAVLRAYTSLHETATGEFGGYEPFQSMLEHTPEQVKEVIMK